MANLRTLICAGLGALLLGCGGGSAPDSALPFDDGKRVIQVSGTLPTSDQVVAARANLEAAPFDGVVFALKAGRTVFQSAGYTPAGLAADLALLPQVNTSKLRENFLLVRGEMEPTFDPFSDAQWAVAMANLQAFADAARTGHLAGLAFDPEAYAGYRSLFDYRNYDSAQHSFAQCQAQLRARGAQFMTTLQQAYPGCRLFLLTGLSSLKLMIEDAQKDASVYAAQLPSSPYGLMPAWINGLLDALPPGAFLIDGNEVTYAYYRSTWYAYEKGVIQNLGARDLLDAANRLKEAAQGGLAMADDLDATFDQYARPSNLAHYLPSALRPQFFEYQVYHGLLASDRYYWVYSEHADWLSRTNIPPGAEAALIEARRLAALQSGLGFDLESALTGAETALRAAGF